MLRYLAIVILVLWNAYLLFLVVFFVFSTYAAWFDPERYFRLQSLVRFKKETFVPNKPERYIKRARIIAPLALLLAIFIFVSQLLESIRLLFD